MGINSLKDRVILLPEARMDYAPEQIDKFIEMWNEGQPISKMCEYFGIAKYEAFLLCCHCELEGWISPREGAFKGTKKHKWKKKEEESGRGDKAKQSI